MKRSKRKVLTIVALGMMIIGVLNFNKYIPKNHLDTSVQIINVELK